LLRFRVRSLLWGGEMTVCPCCNLVVPYASSWNYPAIRREAWNPTASLYGTEMTAMQIHPAMNGEKKKVNKHMESASKLPPGAMEEAGLAPWEAWLRGYPVDGAATGQRCREGLGQHLCCVPSPLGSCSSGTWEPRNSSSTICEPLVEFSCLSFI